MNREQAQEILRLYRPAIDDNDPDVASALHFARQDPEMSRWLNDHCANYNQLRNCFQQMTVPAGLKEQILAERKPEIVPTNIIRREPGWWRNPVVLSAAASILLLLASTWFWIQKSGNEDYTRFRTRMVSTALRTYGMELETNDLQQIRLYLAKQRAPSPDVLPGELTKLEPTGCVVLRWENNPVSMICFKTGRPLRPGETSDVFLFVVEKSVFAKAAQNESPHLEQVNRLATASWTQGDRLFLLAATADQTFLRSLL